jgi:hypothetical protein
MVNMLQLPAYNPGNALDFSSLNNAIDSNRQNALMQSQLGMQKERLGMEREQHGVQMAQARTQQEMQEARMAAGRIRYIQKLPPEQQAAAWKVARQQPGFRDLPAEFDDFNVAAPQILGKASEYLGQKDMAQIDLLRAQALEARRKAANGGETPANIREWQTFNRMTPEDQQRYLTMKRAEKYLDTGNGFIRPNPVAPSGPPVASIPKDVAGAAQQKALGTAQGQAQVDLPKVELGASTTLKYLDDVEKDPYLNRVIGPIDGRTPTLWNQGVQAKIDQLGGRAFLSAFESLKGGGQITEIEGQKATAALSRLTNQAQSEEEYRRAIADFKKEVQALVEIARRRASGGAAPPAATGAPQRLRFNPATGELE